MQRADREILEHPAVLLDAGTVARMVPDGCGRAGGDDRRARGQIRSPVGRRGGGRDVPQPEQLFAQLGGVRAWRRLHFDLFLGELTADQVAQGLAGKTGNPGSGGFWRPRMRVDEEVFLLDAHRCAHCAYLSIIARQQAQKNWNRPGSPQMTWQPSQRRAPVARDRAYMSCGAEKHKSLYGPLSAAANRGKTLLTCEPAGW